MNPSNGKGSVSMPSSSASWRTAGDVVPDQFPAGLRVLVVDDDPTCLMILEKMLRTCLYEVTKCNRAEKALLLLRENKNGFDVVISDVHMPDMDGFKLLEHIGLEMDLPVIMMSADDGKSVVMKGVTHGACDYLIKPVRIEALKNIWQHVVRKRKNEWKDFEQSGSVEEGDRQPKQSDEADYSSSANEGNWKNSKKRKDEDEEADERDDSSTLKKPRVVWSVELHQQFVAAVNQLGIDKAVPKKILELMNVPGLTRENVASHLQKYRLYLRRLSGVSQHPNNLNGSFMGSQEAAFGQLSSLNGLDLQTLAATGQFPAHSLATLQVAGLGRSTAKPGIQMSLADQRNNLFSFENPKLRLGEGPQQHMVNNKQMGGLLHGIPTTMEPKQLANLHHGAQPMGNINMQLNSHGAQSSQNQNNSLLMQMAQSQSRGQILNETATGHLARPILTSGIGTNISVRNGIGENIRSTGFNPVSNTSPMLNFPMSHSNASELSVNSFPLGSSSGVSKGSSFQQDVNSDIKGTAGFMPSFDIFNELHQIESQNWELDNVGMTFDELRHSNSAQGSHDLSQSALLHHGFSSGNAAASGNTMFSANNGTQHGNAQNVNPNLNSLVMANPIRVKTETFHESNPATLFPEHFGQDDLMSALLKQQEGISPADNDFELDGYSIDNL